ncbi:hypothetical protein EYF80_020432 [Liparis tanakae]|uniref:Uncharacterized protein n=1 Tax=Liparis tanakae TaxID=230148 RepID=A0A4Z2HUQ4_9TELE|nr:hypothetical protein EYF80_020432 [Liparis tanakae]
MGGIPSRRDGCSQKELRIRQHNFKAVVSGSVSKVECSGNDRAKCEDYPDISNVLTTEPTECISVPFAEDRLISFPSSRLLLKFLWVHQEDNTLLGDNDKRNTHSDEELLTAADLNVSEDEILRGRMKAQEERIWTRARGTRRAKCHSAFFATETTVTWEQGDFPRPCLPCSHRLWLKIKVVWVHKRRETRTERPDEKESERAGTQGVGRWEIDGLVVQGELKGSQQFPELTQSLKGVVNLPLILVAPSLLNMVQLLLGKPRCKAAQLNN